jgi:hypothetical protein
VWSTRKKAKGVSVSLSVRPVSRVTAPRFTVCPKAKKSVCTVGTVPLGQADELKAEVKIHKSTPTGRRITLTARARGKQAVTFRAKATVVTIASPSPSAPAPIPGATIPAGGLPPLPGEGVSPTDPSVLFPTVAPTAGSSAVASGSTPKHIRAATTSAILPFDSRLIGGQLAGLAVLAGAITVAIARLSLRTQRPKDSKAPPK